MIGNFNFDLPEIYQIEVTNRCNFSCPNCPRFTSNRAETDFDIDLLKLMAKRGDLDNSYFIELQFAGEPLLYPYLDKAVNIIQENNCMVGLSTNGSLIKEIDKAQFNALIQCDYLTISIDGYNQETCERYRPDINFGELVDSINLLLDIKEDEYGTDYLYENVNKSPIITLQIVNFSDEAYLEKSKIELKKIFGGKCLYTTIKNYFHTFSDKPTIDLCLNPFFSVTILANGNVTPCCYMFDEDIIYGNLKDADLRTIWNESEVRKEHIKSFKTEQYFERCNKCSMRSPALLHWDMVLYNRRRSSI